MRLSAHDQSCSPTSAAFNNFLAGFTKRADAGECDLVAKAEIGDVEAGYLYIGSGLFKSDRHARPPINDAVLQHLATHGGHPVTYTCVPRGSGQRIGVDQHALRGLPGPIRGRAGGDSKYCTPLPVPEESR